MSTRSRPAPADALGAERRARAALVWQQSGPTDEEIAHSLKVVASAKENVAKGVGAWVVDGKMIDAPFVVRAENILKTARRLKLL